MSRTTEAQEAIKLLGYSIKNNMKIAGDTSRGGTVVLAVSPAAGAGTARKRTSGDMFASETLPSRAHPRPRLLLAVNSDAASAEVLAAASPPLALISDEFVMEHIFDFLGEGYYRFVAGTNSEFRRLYNRYLQWKEQQRQQQDDDASVSVPPTEWPRETSGNSITASVSCCKFWIEETAGERSVELPQEALIKAGNMATEYGGLEVLKWAHQHGLCLTSLERICEFAASYGHLKVLQWARAKGCSWDKETCTGAAQNGHLEVLQWARRGGCDWSKWTCVGAALKGHLKVLQWAHENGCVWDKDTCGAAAQNGHLECLQWARIHGCDWDSLTCIGAASHGHLEVLKWAQGKGCPWSSFACSEAARYGHFEVLKWARTNGCPWDGMTYLCAYSNGHHEVARWARENGCPVT
jgi:hypothetical protein